MNPYLQRQFEDCGRVVRATIAPRETRTGVNHWTSALVFETDSTWVGAVMVARDFHLNGIAEDELRCLLLEASAAER